MRQVSVPTLMGTVVVALQKVPMVARIGHAAMELLRLHRQLRRLPADRPVVPRRGPHCHSALPFVVPIWFLHINKNEVRDNDRMALV